MERKLSINGFFGIAPKSCQKNYQCITIDKLECVRIRKKRHYLLISCSTEKFALLKIEFSIKFSPHSYDFEGIEYKRLDFGGSISENYKWIDCVDGCICGNRKLIYPNYIVDAKCQNIRKISTTRYEIETHFYFTDKYQKHFIKFEIDIKDVVENLDEYNTESVLEKLD